MFAYSSDKIAKRQRLLAICVFSGIILLIALIQMVCSTIKDPEEIINGSEVLRTHDRICSELPKPPDFKLKQKQLGGNSYTTAISYIFWTGQSFDNLKAFYQRQFASYGWEMTNVVEQEDVRSISFRKERFRVSISYQGYKTGNYAMDCSKLSR